MRRLTLAQKRQVLKDYQKMPVKDVLTKWADYRMVRRDLYKIIGDRKRGARPRKVDDRVTSIIVTQTLRGKTDHHIADITGLSQDTVSRVRNRLGYKAVHRKRKQKD